MSSLVRVVGASILFLVCISFANFSVWVGSWAISRLPLGADVAVVVGLPLLLFLVPVILIGRLHKDPAKQVKQGTQSSKEEIEEYSMLTICKSILKSLCILCPVLMFVACPASSRWIVSRTSGVAEMVSAQEALQHREVAYISFAHAQVLVDFHGVLKVPAAGSGNYHYYYAAPIVPKYVTSQANLGNQTAPRVLTSAEAFQQYQPFHVWLETDNLDALKTADNGTVLGGFVEPSIGDYDETVRIAISERRLQSSPDYPPMVVTLDAPTFDAAISDARLWALFGLGVFNLIIIFIAGVGAQNILTAKSLRL
ncbi:MAG: hypothetical protein GY854_27430 [Deltaproteobacteria bacterium]|nr:hypothetical protein [Deltaproteobacteria bacterium]